jgi:hypothetical protein
MEVLIAIVVLAFALYGVLDLIDHNRRLSLRAEGRAVALELARAKMAEIQAAGYEAVAPLLPAPGDRPSTPVLYPTAPGKFQPPYPDRGYVWQARLERQNQEPDVVNVEVQVLWHRPAFTPSSSFHEHSVSVGGLVVKR